MQVNVHQAKSQLSQLLVAVESGEEVVIARNGVPVARMVPAKKRGGIILGLLEKEGKGFNAPTLEEFNAADKEIEAMFYEGILFPDEAVIDGTKGKADAGNAPSETTAVSNPR